MSNNTTSLDTSSDTPQLFNNDCVLPENWTTAPFAYGEVDMYYLSVKYQICIALSDKTVNLKTLGAVEPVHIYYNYVSVIDQHDTRKPFRKYRKELGDVFTLYFGGRLTIVVSGFETLKEAFLKNGDLFADRPSLYMSDIATRKRVEELWGMISDLFVAGSHTTAAAIRWAIICLVQFPEIQEKVHNNISSSLGDQKLPSTVDKTSLGYLEAFYLERLR
ncbi:cytochrome P450 1A1-like [Mercenaria mercenaria]|uniref:cytochrome P450 1A1-like n=1 Tax=Mercenaria mercenaria TaxID=6596 RepID=UPI00234E4F3A|nr:cytochrome P450 1A1-like [Mercenaria mercenaria]